MIEYFDADTKNGKRLTKRFRIINLMNECKDRKLTFVSNVLFEEASVWLGLERFASEVLDCFDEKTETVNAAWWRRWFNDDLKNSVECFKIYNKINSIYINILRIRKLEKLNK